MSTKKSNIIPLGDRVLVKPMQKDEGKKTASGIIIPETIDKEKPEQGKVVAVGKGRLNDEGNVIPMSVKIGDIVMFSKYGVEEIKVEGEEYYILSEATIPVIIK